MSNLAQNFNYTGNQDPTSHIIFTSEVISPSIGDNRTGGNGAVYHINKKKPIEIKSVYEQLVYIQKSLGFNVLALANILQVSRPTVYEWLESKVDIIRKKNQERLYAIYEISNKWAYKNLDLVNSYLHKPIGSAQHSLFSLLTANELSISEIEQCLSEIEKCIIKKREKNKAHEELLLKHNFEPINREDVNDNLDDLFFRNE